MKLVLEGGGARAAYSAGVVHALTASGVRPRVVIGCSSGSINAAFCASGQTQTLCELWANYVPGKHFISWRRHLTPFAPPGLAIDDMLDRVMIGQGLFDPVAATRGNPALYVAATDVQSGAGVLVQPTRENVVEWLRASLALPVGYNRIVRIGGRGYIDNAPITQLLRDARVLRIFEGPTETMSAFLGARLMGNSASLSQLIAGTLQAPALVPRLDEVAQRVAAVSADLDGPLARGSILWGQMQAGRLATWLVLQAALEGAGNPPSEPESARALRWVRAQLDRELLCLEHGNASRYACLPAQGLSEVVEAFRDRIGDIEQTLPLMSYEPDALLRPSAASSGSGETPTRPTEDAPSDVSTGTVGPISPPIE